MKRTIRLSLLLAGCFLMLVHSSFAQLIRPEKTFFIRPSFGFVNYIGDNNIALSALGIKGQFEAGYQITSVLSLSALYNYGEYTESLRPDPMTGLMRVGSSTQLHNIQTLLRYTLGKPTAEVAPYLHVGGGVAFGGNHLDDMPGWGPVAGLGMDVLISPMTSFFVEANTQFTLPDDAIDGPDRGLFAEHDLLNRVSLGIRVNFKRKAFIPVEITNLNTPTTLEVGELGTFVAEGTISEASEPVYYSWDFGDGVTSPLLRASHSFDEPGRYTVTFDARNDQSSDGASRTVIVVPKATPAEIISMNSMPATPDTRTVVTFDAGVLGNEPMSYTWRFGDGLESTEVSPEHTFDRAGRYIVELSVSNPDGRDTKTMEVNVDRYEAAFCEEITALNTVYFGRHSSVLSQAARDILADNLEILRECPNIQVRIEGFAVPGETSPNELAADRARAVEDYYVDNGVTQSRIFSLGQGQVRGIGQMKDGLEQFRRADTILIER